VQSWTSALTFVVLGSVLFVAGLLLALDVKGLGEAWIKADLWLSRESSDEVVLARRVKRRRAYFWALVALGALLITRGAFGLA
jgi:hypothetical protein